MGVVIFNGRSSKDIGLVVEHLPGYETPERDYEIVHVPGRNGDVVIDKGSYKNVKRQYQIAMLSMDERFPELSNRISEWLHSASGYARLEDTYEPEYYRMAMYSESGSFTNIVNHASRAKISFDCKPQRYLKSGDVVYKDPTCLQNPTVHTALPIITVKGTGEANIGFFSDDEEYYIWVQNINGSITINSELQDCYTGNTNRNADVMLGSYTFPKLEKGNTFITVNGSGVTSLEVTPKWWTI